MTSAEVLVIKFCKLTIEMDGYCDLYNYNGRLDICPYQELTHLWTNRKKIWQSLTELCGYEVAGDMVNIYLPYPHR